MKIRYAILSALICLFGSCSVGNYVAITTNHPATILFDHDYTKVLVVNAFDFNRLGIKPGKRLQALKSGAFTSLNYAANKLKQLKGVNAIYLADTISTDSINVIASKHHADYVLALTNYNAGFDADDYQQHKKRDKAESYTTVDFNLQVTADYVLYNKNGKACKQLNGFTSDFNQSGDVPNVFLVSFYYPDIEKNSVALNKSATNATDKALQGFFDYTTNHNRPLYNNDELSEAVTQIQLSNYAKADSILKPLTLAADKQLAAKAAYDLAVVYEANGDLKGAIAMTQLSLSKDDNQKTQALLNEYNTAIAALP